MRHYVITLMTVLLIGVAMDSSANEPVDAAIESQGTVDGAFNSQSGNVDSNNLTVHGDSYTGSTTRVNNSKNTPQAIAPQLTAGYDTCTVSTTGAVSGPGVGISLGRTKRDMLCEQLKLTKMLEQMGLKDAAVALLMQDDRVDDAIRAVYPQLAAKIDGVEYVEPVSDMERMIEESERERAFEIMKSRAEMEFYTLKDGDTLYTLSGGKEAKFNYLLELNPGMDPFEIVAGTTIRVY